MGLCFSQESVLELWTLPEHVRVHYAEWRFPWSASDAKLQILQHDCKNGSLRPWQYEESRFPWTTCGARADDVTAIANILQLLPKTIKSYVLAYDPVQYGKGDFCLFQWQVLEEPWSVVLSEDERLELASVIRNIMVCDQLEEEEYQEFEDDASDDDDGWAVTRIDY